jgi:hypothetical protein
MKLEYSGGKQNSYLNPWNSSIFFILPFWSFLILIQILNPDPYPLTPVGSVHNSVSIFFLNSLRSKELHFGLQMRLGICPGLTKISLKNLFATNPALLCGFGIITFSRIKSYGVWAVEG